MSSGSSLLAVQCWLLLRFGRSLARLRTQYRNRIAKDARKTIKKNLKEHSTGAPGDFKTSVRWIRWADLGPVLESLTVCGAWVHSTQDFNLITFGVSDAHAFLCHGLWGMPTCEERSIKRFPITWLQFTQVDSGTTIPPFTCTNLWLSWWEPYLRKLPESHHNWPSKHFPHWMHGSLTPDRLPQACPPKSFQKGSERCLPTSAMQPLGTAESVFWLFGGLARFWLRNQFTNCKFWDSWF